MKDVIVIGGPNGAGKTTTANRLLPKELDLREFLNADEIARGLAPFDPEGNAVPAGRLMIERIDQLVAAGKSFAFETTCAGHRQAKLLRRCREAGYRVTFIYLWLPSAQFAIERVAQRVAQGGHNIPEDVIVRRYAAGVYNMRHVFLPLADVASIYDNSVEPSVLIGAKDSASPFTVYDAARWRLIEDATREDVHGPGTT
jgi:predicted ABC-type ATPase